MSEGEALSEMINVLTPAQIMSDKRKDVDILLGSPPRRPKILWASARSGAPNAKEVSLDELFAKISSVQDKAVSLCGAMISSPILPVRNKAA